MSMPSLSIKAAHARHVSLIGHDLSWETPDGRPVLRGLSFALGRERTGLVGPNGVGKTTLIRLLTGDLRPSRGRIECLGSMATLPQDFEVEGDRTVADVLGIQAKLEALERVMAGEMDDALYTTIDDDWDVGERARALLARVGLEQLALDRRIRTLSGGETTRVVLAGRLILEPDFLILDEPTNNLDRDAREALYDLVDLWEGGLLVVSHDRELLEHVDQVLELSAAGLQRYGGSYSDYEAQREVEAAAAQRRVVEAEQQLRRDEREARSATERQERRLARGKRSRLKGGMPRIVMNMQRGRAQVTTARLQGVHEDRVSGSAQRLQDAKQAIRPENVIQIDLEATQVASGRGVVDLQEVWFSFVGDEGPFVLEDVNFTLVGPSRVAVLGANGAGKTTLLRLMLGDLEPTRGVVRRNASEVAWLDPRTALLNRSETVLENYRRLNPAMPESLIRLRLGRFLFRGDAALKRVADLSGGERMRAALACVLAGETPPRLLVLDEPTNNLDLDSIEQVESALGNYRGALLVVSHDQRFLERIGIETALTLG